VQLISNQPRYSELWRVIEADVVPTSKRANISDRLVADCAGRAHRQGNFAPKLLPLDRGWDRDYR
jgi:hypothetical protein